MDRIVPAARRRISQVVGRSAGGHGVVGAMAVVLALIVASAAPAAAALPRWTTPLRLFASSGSPAYSLAVDAVGAVHIAVEGVAEPGIWYLTDESGAWTSTRLTVRSDRYPSIGVEDGAVTIAFARQEAGDRGIFTVSDASGEWVASRRHTGPDGPPSLGVRAGVGHVAFVTPGTGLVHASGPVDAPSDAGWSLETVDATCCAGSPSLRLTASGLPRIAYPDGSPATPGPLRLALRSAGGTWSGQVVDTGRTATASLVLGDGDRPGLTYVRRGSGTWYAVRDTAGWKRRLLDATAFGPPDLASDTNSMVFVWSGRGIVRYASYSGGVIFSSTLATGSAGSPRIVRYRGRPIVAFERSGAGVLDGLYVTRGQ
jgi:hypothetical protein